jgi:predicted dehydrogenase
MSKNAKMSGKSGKVSRRRFLGTSAKAATAASVAAAALRPGHLFAAGSDELRIGLIGCGGRGTRAAVQSLLSTDTPVKLIAMGDLFRDQLDKSYALLEQGGKKRYDTERFGPMSKRLDVPEERKFVGFDAYKKVLATDIDIAILATPPAFRPEHFEAAIAAGKHVFMEKPVAVDPAGIRKVIAAAAKAEKANLSVVAGTQRRHQLHYIEVMKRVHDGAIGEILSGQAYWNMGPLWLEEADYNWANKDKWSAMEWQCRNWLFIAWLSGDHICEQHVHNLDIMNWGLRAHPVAAMGMGGRQARVHPKYGNIFDHFAIDLEYPNGVHVSSYCRQMEGSANLIAERLVGTKGVAYTDGEGGWIKGDTPYEFAGEETNPYYQEHADLIVSIREGKPLKEGRQVAESTMVAIMGRMCAYTANDVTWDWAMNDSKLDLVPESLELGDHPLAPPAVPGQTKLI